MWKRFRNWPMTSADAAAITVIVMAPLLVAGRIIVRNSRGEAFTPQELATALGGLAVAAALVTFTRAPARLVMLALPSVIISLGLVALWNERRPGGGDRTRQSIGSAAVVAGIVGLIVAIVRAASAN
jgi:hypothetical protein